MHRIAFVLCLAGMLAACEGDRAGGKPGDETADEFVARADQN